MKEWQKLALVTVDYLTCYLCFGLMELLVVMQVQSRAGIVLHIIFLFKTLQVPHFMFKSSLSFFTSRKGCSCVTKHTQTYLLYRGIVGC